MNKKKTIIMDLDDTLIDTSHLYWTVRTEVLELIREICKEDIGVLIKRFEEIEKINSDKYGYDPLRYSYSAEELCNEYGIENIEVIKQTAKKIKSEFPLKIKGADEILDYLSKSYNLILLTRGIKDLQFKKIEYAGLNKYFDENNTRVVANKTVKTFLNIIKDFTLDASNCIVIGDSVKADIKPAIECGIQAIHYDYKHEHYVWEHDKEISEHSFKTIESLLEIKDIL